MGKVIVSGFSLSIDGFGAGSDQSPEEPLGKGGEDLHEWQFGTRAFREIHGESGGTEGIASDSVARFTQGVGSFILDRNMFGPIRDDWFDEEWKGKSVTIGGGVATIRQYLQAELVDEVHFAIAPVVLGRGEAMSAGIDLPALGYRIIKHAATEAATHTVLAK